MTNKKVCINCRKNKIVGEFYKDSKVKCGLQGKCKVCVLKDRQKQGSKYSAIINNIKNRYGCQQCGEGKVHALSFHHINPQNKRFNISSIKYAGYKQQSIIDEIEKCIILCHNCHSGYHYYDNLNDKSVQIFLDGKFMNNKCELIENDYMIT